MEVQIGTPDVNVSGRVDNHVNALARLPDGVALTDIAADALDVQTVQRPTIGTFTREDSNRHSLGDELTHDVVADETRCAGDESER
jgi:hypothetical protein